MEEAKKFRGMIPANLLPFKADHSIHEKDYRRHLRWLSKHPQGTGRGRTLRKAIPGIITAQRFMAHGGSPKYLALYDLDR